MFIVSDVMRKKTFQPLQLLETFDSVKVEYVDPATNKKAYIYRKLDGVGLVVDGIGANPKSIELAGCRNSYNAINRAELEIRMLMYQRFSLTDTMLSGGMLLDKGSMVLYAEQYDSNSKFDGEILSVSGNVATVSEPIYWEDGQDYEVYYTTDDGSVVGPFPAIEIIGNNKSFECPNLDDAFVRDSVIGYEIQTGSRYIIATTTEFINKRWTVTEKEVSGRNVQVTMVNYDDAMFEFDEA